MSSDQDVGCSDQSPILLNTSGKEPLYPGAPGTDWSWLPPVAVPSGIAHSHWWVVVLSQHILRTPPPHSYFYVQQFFTALRIIHTPLPLTSCHGAWLCQGWVWAPGVFLQTPSQREGPSPMRAAQGGGVFVGKDPGIPQHPPVQLQSPLSTVAALALLDISRCLQPPLS